LLSQLRQELVVYLLVFFFGVFDSVRSLVDPLHTLEKLFFAGVQSISRSLETREIFRKFLGLEVESYFVVEVLLLEGAELFAEFSCLLGFCFHDL
jgi:hypothetical protein